MAVDPTDLETEEPISTPEPQVQGATENGTQDAATADTNDLQEDGAAVDAAATTTTTPVRPAGPSAEEEEDALTYQHLTQGQQEMSGFLMLLAYIFGGPGGPLEGQLSQVMGFGNDTGAFQQWRSDTMTQYSNPTEAARHHNYANVDFAQAAQIRLSPEMANTLVGTIFAGESAGGNYDIVNGSTEPTWDGKKLTEMTIGEVLSAQSRRNHGQEHWRGSASSAVGAYQIIHKTLEASVQQMGLSLDQPFDKDTQDQIGMHLMKQRGLESFLNGEIGMNTFMDRIGHEWASMPINTYGSAAYGGTANNPASVGQVKGQHTAAVMVAAREAYQNGATLEEVVGIATRQEETTEIPVAEDDPTKYDAANGDGQIIAEATEAGVAVDPSALPEHSPPESELDATPNNTLQLA